LAHPAVHVKRHGHRSRPFGVAVAREHYDWNVTQRRQCLNLGEAGGGHRRCHCSLGEDRFRRRWIGRLLQRAHFLAFFLSKPKRNKDVAEIIIGRPGEVRRRVDEDEAGDLVGVDTGEHPDSCAAKRVTD
jgi:hypothetical protein